MSRAISTRSVPVKRTKAVPSARARSSSSWSGTVPRMSYALKTVSRDVATGGSPYWPVVHPPGGVATNAGQVAQHVDGRGRDAHGRRAGGGERHRHRNHLQP